MSAVDKLYGILEGVIVKVHTLSRKGLLPEGDIEGLERVACEAEMFLRPQVPSPSIHNLAPAHFNELTPAQAERLAILMEEMGEATQVIGKVLRHGFDSCHPDDPKVTNRQLLLKELVDVTVGMVMVSLDVPEMMDQVETDKRLLAGLAKKLQYCHHQEDFDQFIEALNLI